MTDNIEPSSIQYGVSNMESSQVIQGNNSKITNIVLTLIIALNEQNLLPSHKNTEQFSNGTVDVNSKPAPGPEFLERDDEIVQESTQTTSSDPIQCGNKVSEDSDVRNNNGFDVNDNGDNGEAKNLTPEFRAAPTTMHGKRQGISIQSEKKEPKISVKPGNSQERKSCFGSPVLTRCTVTATVMKINGAWLAIYFRLAIDLLATCLLWILVILMNGTLGTFRWIKFPISTKKTELAIRLILLLLPILWLILIIQLPSSSLVHWSRSFRAEPTPYNSFVNLLQGMRDTILIQIHELKQAFQKYVDEALK